MLPVFAPLFAAAIVAMQAPAPRRHKHHVRATTVAGAAGPSLQQERALRRRVVRLARIKMLERKEAMLFSFLAQAHTEAPLFEDSSEIALGAGIFVGPTIVTRDFLGSPVVRTRIRNASTHAEEPLITAHLQGPEGDVEVSGAVGMLLPGASRALELRSPSMLSPSSLRWSMMLL